MRLLQTVGPLLAMLLPVCLLALAPIQNTWYVDANNPGPGSGSSGDPFITLQEAIDAPTTLSGDSIRVRDGVYREAVEIDGKALRVIAGHGQADVAIERLDSMGAACLTVRNVASPGVLIAGFQFLQPANAASSGRGIEVEAAELQVSRCNLDSLVPAGSSSAGGAMRAGPGSTLELLGCSIRDCGGNNVAGGGAVSFEGDALSMEGCSFAGNTSGWRGGAVWFNGLDSMVIRNSSFINNQAMDGGAIWVEATAAPALIRSTEFLLNGNTGTHLSGGVAGHGVIEDCLFRRNLGQTNGAVSGEWDIHGSEFDRNGGSDSGNWASAVHGLPRCSLTDCYIHDHFGGSSFLAPSAVINADLVGCVFENNRVAVDNFMNFINGGGAITDCVAVNCVFEDNLIFASGCSGTQPNECGRGGAAFRCELTDCVLTGNSAAYGGAAAESELTNCTVYGNTSHVGAGALWGGSMANCIAFENGASPLGDGAVATWSCVEFGAPGTGNISSDPEFLLASAGDLRLRGSSPCIDAGDPALTDPDGTRRDMGAFPFDGDTPQSYCLPGPDSQGCVPSLRSTQPPSATTPFLFEATGVLATTATLSFLAMTPTALPYLNGQLCIGAPLQRGPVGIVTTHSSDPCDTTAQFTLMPADLLQGGFTPGDAIYAQVIYRDPGAAQGIAITGALATMFQP